MNISLKYISALKRKSFLSSFSFQKRTKRKVGTEHNEGIKVTHTEMKKSVLNLDHHRIGLPRSVSFCRLSQGSNIKKCIDPHKHKYRSSLSKSYLEQDCSENAIIIHQFRGTRVTKGHFEEMILVLLSSFSESLDSLHGFKLCQKLAEDGCDVLVTTTSQSGKPVNLEKQIALKISTESKGDHQTFGARSLLQGEKM